MCCLALSSCNKDPIAADSIPPVTDTTKIGDFEELLDLLLEHAKPSGTYSTPDGEVLRRTYRIQQLEVDSVSHYHGNFRVPEFIDESLWITDVEENLSNVRRYISVGVERELLLGATRWTKDTIPIYVQVGSAWYLWFDAPVMVHWCTETASGPTDCSEQVGEISYITFRLM